MRITGDNDEGKAQLDNFIDPESTFPVIATTSRSCPLASMPRPASSSCSTAASIR